MIRKPVMAVVALLTLAFLPWCTTPTMEYRHVYVLENLSFRYVDPREEIVRLAEKDLDTDETYSLYLYEPEEGSSFSYTDFFTYLGDHFLYRHPDTGEYYTREKSDIGEKITQYYIDKEAFQNQ